MNDLFKCWIFLEIFKISTIYCNYITYPRQSISMKPLINTFIQFEIVFQHLHIHCQMMMTLSHLFLPTNPISKTISFTFISLVWVKTIFQLNYKCTTFQIPQVIFDIVFSNITIIWHSILIYLCLVSFFLVCHWLRFIKLWIFRPEFKSLTNPVIHLLKGFPRHHCQITLFMPYIRRITQFIFDPILRSVFSYVRLVDWTKSIFTCNETKEWYIN